MTKSQNATTARNDGNVGDLSDRKDISETVAIYLHESDLEEDDEDEGAEDDDFDDANSTGVLSSGSKEGIDNDTVPSLLNDDDIQWGVNSHISRDADSAWGDQPDDFSVSVYNGAAPTFVPRKSKSLPISKVVPTQRRTPGASAKVVLKARTAKTKSKSVFVKSKAAEATTGSTSLTTTTSSSTFPSSSNFPRHNVQQLGEEDATARFNNSFGNLAESAFEIEKSNRRASYKRSSSSSSHKQYKQESPEEKDPFGVITRNDHPVRLSDVAKEGTSATEMEMMNMLGSFASGQRTTLSDKKERKQGNEHASSSGTARGRGTGDNRRSRSSGPHIHSPNWGNSSTSGGDDGNTFSKAGERRRRRDRSKSSDGEEGSTHSRSLQEVRRRTKSTSPTRHVSTEHDNRHSASKVRERRRTRSPRRDRSADDGDGDRVGRSQSPTRSSSHDRTFAAAVAVDSSDARATRSNRREKRNTQRPIKSSNSSSSPTLESGEPDPAAVVRRRHTPGRSKSSDSAHLAGIDRGQSLDEGLLRAQANISSSGRRSRRRLSDEKASSQGNGGGRALISSPNASTTPTATSSQVKGDQVDQAGNAASSSSSRRTTPKSRFHLDTALKFVDANSGGSKKSRRDAKSVQSEAIPRRSNGDTSSSRRGRRPNLHRSHSDQNLSADNDGGPRMQSRSTEPSKESNKTERGTRSTKVRLEAEEARIRQLQEEARLLEEKRMAEEARLAALREEARVMEEKNKLQRLAELTRTEEAKVKRLKGLYQQN